jgi:hypothetical protein
MNTPLKIRINIRAIKTIALATSSDKSRPWLDGVYFDVTGFAVATNSSSLICGALDATPHRSFIMPRKFLDQIKLRRSGFDDYAQLQLSDEHGSVEYSNTTYVFKEVDGCFPDYKRIIPDTVSLKPAYYDPYHLSLLQKAIAMSKGGNGITPNNSYSNIPVIAMNGESPAIVTGFEGNIFGVIMPVFSKLNESATRAPPWFNR